MRRMGEKTKGALIVVVVACVLWGGYRGYYLVQWMKLGIFHAYDAYDVLAQPVMMPDGNRVFLVKDEQGREVRLPMAQALRLISSQWAGVMSTDAQKPDSSKVATPAKK